MNNTNARTMALCGVFAALAVVIMSMGTLIPIATFVCPMLCMMILQIVLRFCGSRLAWTWYAAVALLSVLLAPDKESAAVFLFLGYYPIVKPKMDLKPVPILWKLLLFIVIGGAVVVWGANISVNAATALATAMGISEKFIGLTIVALGTSLPELVASVTAARKGNADIAIGNIVGSNIFNILFVLGTSALIIPIPYQGSFLFDGLVTVGAGVLLWLATIKKKALGRVGGIVMLLCYGAYLVYLLVQH